MKKLALLIGLFAFLIFMGTAKAEWAESSLAYCRNITIPSSKVITTQSNFPVLLVLNGTRVNYTATQSAGQDIRIRDAGCNMGGNAVPYEIELWNESGNSYVWLKASSLSNSSDTIYSYYYGNSTIADAQNKTGVWDSSFIGVWHMNDIYESTSYGYNLAETGSVVNKTGQVDGSKYMDGSTYASNSSFVSPTTYITVESLIKVGTATAIDRMISQWSGGDNSNGNGWILQIINNNIGMQIGNGGAFINYTSSSPINSTAVWYHIAGVFNGTAPTILIYLNGVNQAATPSGSSKSSIANPSQPMYINRLFFSGGYYSGNDTYDEIRISNQPRSQTWLNLTYQSNIDNLVAYGSEEGIPVGIVQTSLISPANSNITNATLAVITFNCSATTSSETLSNITLWGSWGGWHANETQAKTGAYNFSIFTKALPEGIYTWNCQACNNISSCSFGESNYSFTIEQLSIPSIAVLSPSGFYDNWNASLKRFNDTWSVPLSFTNSTNLATVVYSIDGGSNITTSNGSVLNLDALKHNITVCGQNIVGEWGCGTGYYEINGGIGKPKILLNYTLASQGSLLSPMITADSFDWDNDGVKEIVIGTLYDYGSLYFLDNCSSLSCTQPYKPPQFIANAAGNSDRWAWNILTGDMGGSDGVINELCSGSGGGTTTYLKCFKWNGTGFEINFTASWGGGSNKADVEAHQFCNMKGTGKPALIGTLYDSTGGGDAVIYHNYSDSGTSLTTCRPSSAISCQDIDGNGLNETLIGCADINLIQAVYWNTSASAYQVRNIVSLCSNQFWKKDSNNLCDYRGDGNKSLLMFCAAVSPFHSNYTRFNATSIIGTYPVATIALSGQVANPDFPDECSIASYWNATIYRNASSTEAFFIGKPIAGNTHYKTANWVDVDNDGYSEIGYFEENMVTAGNKWFQLLDFSPEIPELNITWNMPANNSFTLNLSSILWNASISDNPNTCILNINGTINYSMLISGNYCYYTTSSLTNQTTYCGIIYSNNSASNVSSMRCATVNLTQAPPIPPTPPRPIDNIGMFGGIALLILGAGVVLFILEGLFGAGTALFRNPKGIMLVIIASIVMIAMIMALL